MKLATLLVIVVSNHGYWLGGQPATINLRSAVQGGLPGADLLWELDIADQRLGSGKISLEGKDKETVLHLTAPVPRVRVTLVWRYRIVDRHADRTLETGDVPIELFPDQLMDGLAKTIGVSRIAVWDVPGGIPDILNAAKVPHRRASTAGQLRWGDADVILVGPNVLSDSPFDQSILVNLAKSGASVMVFRQAKISHLAGYDLADRAVSDRIRWRFGHSLFSGFEPRDVRDWNADVQTLRVVRLPADEPAMDIVGYEPDEDVATPVGIDSILLSKSVGRGRMVLCQLPLGKWQSDPRSQMFLRNAMDYLLTRPEPTLRPSELRRQPPAKEQIVTTPEILTGDRK